ncbi:hypothetical protein DBV15_00285 [Temnothorax longispinosus]|uniref:Uncharacterized protein n=1 Tax=Temnothorax longispinosus TaxID=300112 RepID=A0A4V3SBW2_9HYME|nr:hypothetical protein DBV15_00285 [Temnothorax longispinosus]
MLLVDGVRRRMKDGTGKGRSERCATGSGGRAATERGCSSCGQTPTTDVSGRTREDSAYGGRSSAAIARIPAVVRSIPIGVPGLMASANIEIAHVDTPFGTANLY